MDLIQSLKLATVLMAISCSVRVHVQALNIGVQSVNSGIASVCLLPSNLFFFPITLVVGVYGLRVCCAEQTRMQQKV